MNTKACHSHFSAAVKLNVPFLSAFFGFAFAPDRPSDYTVFHRRDLFRSPGLRIHLCSQDLPAGAVLFHSGERVVSPEYLFVQCCSQLGIIPAIILGCLLCMAGPFGQSPLTTPYLLKKFASEAHFVRGRPRALDALRYVRDNFRFPMEVMRYMMLDLPNHLGGCALGGSPELNTSVGISYEDAIALGQSFPYLIPDAYYPAQKLIQEYYGEEVHSSPQARRHDELRENILRANGYQVVVIRKRNLYNLKNFAKLHTELADLFQKRIRISSLTYRKHFAEIYAMLPRSALADPANQYFDEFDRNRNLDQYFLTMKVRERTR